MLVLVFLLKCGHQQMDASTDIGEKEITFFFFFFFFSERITSEPRHCSSSDIHIIIDNSK